MHNKGLEPKTSGVGSGARLATVLLTLASVFAITCSAVAGNALDWRAKESRVSADINGGNLRTLLEDIASRTGWQIFLEPDSTHVVSAKFRNLPTGEALRLLLGDLNFALVPETNSPSKLYVFRTSRQYATLLIRPTKATESSGQAKLITNELIVRLKPGAKIDEIARLLGAKVVGRIDGMNAYRLRFEDEELAATAREKLASNPEVASVEDNFSIDRPPVPREASAASVGPPHLQLKPPADNGQVIVGLVDTAVQSLGKDLDSFFLKAQSVAGDAHLDPSAPSHGTAMAETILRSLEMATKGSTSVQILPIDVYGPNASTSTFDVALGIVQAVNGGAKIINLSLGSNGDSPFLRDLVKEVSGKEIVLIGAKGNEPVTTPFFPAAYEGSIPVTAIDGGQVAPYANRAAIPEIGAPGTGIVHYGGGSYYVMGTSVSAAYVSGMASGYMELNKKSGAETKSFLFNTLGVNNGK
jgi:hypothetical protein